MIHPESSIFSGLIRLSLGIVILFLVNKKYINSSNTLTFFDFFVYNWFRYAGILILMIFILVMINAYNLFNCLLFVVIVISSGFFLEKTSNKTIEENLNNIKNKLIIFFKKIESKKKLGIKVLINKAKKNIEPKEVGLVALVLCSTTFLSRRYFSTYDNYIFSDTWINDLRKISNFDLQIWFNNDYSLSGELAMVNFYSKIIDVSSEVAIQSIAIIESILLATIIFWTVKNLVPSRFSIPLISSSFFSLIYVLSPLNINYLLEKNSNFLALSFAIPILIFFIKSPVQKITLGCFFFSCVLSFIVIGLIDLFTFIILIPPVMIISIFFTKRSYILMSISSILLYLLSLSVLLVIYNIYCYYFNLDLIEFFHFNLVSVNSNAYSPQLILPYERILFYMECISYVGFLLLLILHYYRKLNLRIYYSSFIYFNFLILLTSFENGWIDQEILNKSFAIFLPIILGLHLAIVYQIFNTYYQKPIKFFVFSRICLMFILFFLSIFFQQKKIQSFQLSDQSAQVVLNAYDKIAQDFFPFTYTVVNDSRTQMISLKKHFFMNYSSFTNEYLNLDNTYFKNRLKPKFLINNPEFALTSSVLVFVLLKQKKISNDIFSVDQTSSVSINKKLAVLKKRGRKIDLYYENKNLKVYEIVNEPSKSKISDLIF